ncbi:HlyD family efflux transporter periplasmic adaptor subunit [Candidatus Kapabacteria bacterium]|nr:HlyD family efflux transporter periplasmic adaptor subunit [Candidatus Kapabacteria bacterium]
MKFFIYTLIIVSTLSIGYFLFISENEEQNYITVKPEFGRFDITVTTTGELEAISSIKIMGPELTEIGIYNQVKISKLIDEGTIVKEGDFVATLDPTPVVDLLDGAKLGYDQKSSELKIAKLDSTQTLTSARDNITNLKYSMEEAKLQMEQSKFEAPSIIRQAEISYEKAKRSYENSITNYDIQVQKSVATVQVATAEMQKRLNEISRIQSVLQKMKIMAPSNGMFTYARRGSRKIEVNSQISTWFPQVGELPDLSKMRSRTYVNEIDIQKVKKGQNVSIGLDANADKNLSGQVVSVANIGQEMEDSDAKVFEVIIEINEKDTTLRPAMTTNNEILVKSYQEALSIPLEAIFIDDNDSTKIEYVYLKEGNSITKNEIIVGDINENSGIVLDGLDIKSELLLSEPANSQNIVLIKLDEKSKTNISKSDSQQIEADS